MGWTQANCHVLQSNIDRNPIYLAVGTGKKLRIHQSLYEH